MKTTTQAVQVHFVHFSAFGASMQPRCADATGFLRFREGYERLPREQWTEAEEWIAERDAVINEWRSRN
jgi:hypothetical protein